MITPQQITNSHFTINHQIIVNCLCSLAFNGLHYKFLSLYHLDLGPNEHTKKNRRYTQNRRTNRTKRIKMYLSMFKMFECDCSESTIRKKISKLIHFFPCTSRARFSASRPLVVHLPTEMRMLVPPSKIA